MSKITRSLKKWEVAQFGKEGEPSVQLPPSKSRSFPFDYAQGQDDNSLL
jgi:hypothetical protein